MLAQKIMAASLRHSQLGGALVVNCMRVEPRFCLGQKISRNGDKNWPEEIRNFAAYAFFSSLLLPITGQVNFEVEGTVADCKELGIPRV